MGSCCSCLKLFLSSSGIEMTNTENSDNEDVILGETNPQIYSIDVAMSAPTIAISAESNNVVSGHGLALVDVTVEQDRAYWEWRVTLNGRATSTMPIMFGVSNKRNDKFYEILANSTIPSEKHGTKFMCGIPNLKSEDVVGVVVQQSEIPMIQLFLNGDVLDELQVSRFRGTVYPSIYLPQCSEGSISAIFLYRDDQFIHGPPSPGISPLIPERRLM